MQSEKCSGSDVGGSADNGGVDGCREACGFAGTDHSGEWKQILLIAQSINGLLWVSQLCPMTREQEPSSGVTYKDVGVISLVSKWGERVIAHVIVLFMVPLKDGV